MTKTAKNRRFTADDVIRILERLTAEEFQAVLAWIGNTDPGDLWTALLRTANLLLQVWFQRNFRHAPGTVISQQNINDLLRVDSEMHKLLTDTSRVQEQIAKRGTVDGIEGRAEFGPRPFPPGKGDDAPQDDIPLEYLVAPLDARFRAFRTPSDPSRDREIDEEFEPFSDSERDALIEQLIKELQARNPPR